jgi:glycerol-3-phosphate dehydrogenase
LASLYGSRLPAVLAIAEKGSRGKQTLCMHSKEITAQIWYAVAEESAITLSDFMFRRSSLGLMECQGSDAADVVAKEMTRLLGWSPQEQKQQITDYTNTLALGQRYKE